MKPPKVKKEKTIRLRCDQTIKIMALILAEKRGTGISELIRQVINENYQAEIESKLHSNF